jgi:hypothetical protein
MKNKQGSRHHTSEHTSNSKRHALDAGDADEEAGRHDEPDRRHPVKDQRRGRGNRARFFSGHVAHASDVHELITKDAPSIQEGKEATDQQ